GARRPDGTRARGGASAPGALPGVPGEGPQAHDQGRATAGVAAPQGSAAWLRAKGDRRAPPRRTGPGRARRVLDNLARERRNGRTWPGRAAGSARGGVVAPAP